MGILIHSSCGRTQGCTALTVPAEEDPASLSRKGPRVARFSNDRAADTLIRNNYPAILPVSLVSMWISTRKEQLYLLAVTHRHSP